MSAATRKAGAQTAAVDSPRTSAPPWMKPLPVEHIEVDGHRAVLFFRWSRTQCWSILLQVTRVAYVSSTGHPSHQLALAQREALLANLRRLLSPQVLS